MNNEVPWIASLCVQERVIDAKLAGQIVDSMPANADAMVFAQAVIDRAGITDIELMTRLATEAQELSASGTQPPSFLPKPAVKAPAPSAAATAAPAPVAVRSLPRMDFSTVKSLPDNALKPFMLELLGAADSVGASDLHLSAGSPPYIRNQRAIEFLSDVTLTAADTLRLNTSLLGDDQKKLFSTHHDYDYALAMEGGRRIRVNLMEHKEGVKGTYRIVPETIRTPAQLGFKNLAVIKRLLSYHNGLILVTGPVGAGKTTTLNSLIDELNRTREDHIITVEDPIEYLHTSQGCNVTQRQVGQHTLSFANALKSALREDPDVIVIGELRDLPTIEMAISASETGHLVIGTMHTSDSGSTLNRLLDVFPPSQQPQIRAMVAQSLRGILCQRLLPARDGGVALACEVLVNTTAISAMVRDSKTQGIPSAIDTGRREGMISMDNAVLELWQEKKITDEVAANNILNRVIRQQIPGAR
ncbi:type IV pilus twitching motility protein PilT [Rariglobus hedericola]|uniref:PilT/PilU family type 4a pilus ATPase n=1 Tax=Rariglobus hedericola TaxID=2597822 RepID=A0A556QKQ6_9BACT|nr:PilT/PilU family type 4a pilus ATPase [Rariglobus hedericola]TSJ77219.1 PilT/PilU family type 4a pilus ATPase [Rariglobus hedericola]